MIRRVFALAAVAASLAVPTDSCSFEGGPLFTYEARPDYPVSAYVAGRLGVVSAFRPSYLVVAYRYLAGKAPSKAERKELTAYYDERLPDSRIAAGKEQEDPNAARHAWVAASSAIAGAKDRPASERSNGHHGYYVNCTDGAFNTATATLKARIAAFGANSAALRSWLEAQHAVFANCEGHATPTPADPSLPLLIRQDRAYQLAASSFYAEDYPNARSAFLAISRDPASPWRRISRLVAARALIRLSMLSRNQGFDLAPMVAAREEMEVMAADPDMGELRESARDLAAFADLRLEPIEHAQKLAAAIAGGHLTHRNLADYLFLLNHDAAPKLAQGMVPPYDVDDLSLWLATMDRPVKKDYGKALERWRATKSTPWLVAALTLASGKSEGVDDLLAASAEVGPPSPAFATLAYRHAMIFAERGDRDAAAREAGAVLDGGEKLLGPGSRNLFLALRLPSAASLDAFVADAVRAPAGVSSDDIVDYYPPLFDSDGANVFNQYLPLSSLIAAARMPQLVPSIRAQLLAAAFTRALVLGRYGVAAEFVPDVRAAFPALKEPLGRFAKSPHRIEAVDFLLQVPSFSPYIAAGWSRILDDGWLTDVMHSSGHENWWCRERASGYQQEPLPKWQRGAPMFAREAGIQAEAAAEKHVLEEAGSGAAFLLRGITAWAKARPKDPRVPKALSRIVKGTQWACADPELRKLAPAAFDLLHSRYGDTRWARETKYWYTGGG